MEGFKSNQFFFFALAKIVFRKCPFVFRMLDMYSALADEELDAIVAEIQLSHPNTGYRMMRSFLHARGLRVQSKFDIKFIPT